MPALLEIGLANALAATALALAAAAVGWHRRRPALAHSLWLLVLLKLVTPPLVSFPVEWPAPVATRMEQVPPQAAEPQGIGAMHGDDVAPRETFTSEIAIIAPLPTKAEPTLEPRPVPVTGLVPPKTTSSWRVRPWAAVAGLWLAGTVLYVIVTGVRLLRFESLARQARVAPDELRVRVEKLANQLGMARAPLVGLVAGRIAPLLWAVFGRPRLLLPEQLWARLDCDQRDALLLHELAHLRRRDHWVRLLELLVRSLYWWHPVVWWAGARLRQFEEECCDAWVVHARPGSVRSYATALVETLDFLAEARGSVPVAASGLGHFWSLKRRLAMILDATTPPALSGLARLAVLGLAALLLPLSPTWAQPPATTPADADAQAPAPRPATPAADTAPVNAAQRPLPSVTVQSDDVLPDDKELPRATTPRATRRSDTLPPEDGSTDFKRSQRAEIARQYARVDEAKLAVVRAQSE
ncbi:MAG TPA: M56 family metallopeptidase, partial [Isosphaeraceae bacterium]|nr:M56 family metallopeptidase [Isosphaeraceae bacterium]